MLFGVHLPLIGFDERPFTLSRLKGVARRARELGYTSIAANDHLIFASPWLDGPTALATVLEETGDLELVTTVALPVVRGPAALAKTLTAIDVLSGGRLTVGVGPGSSPRDYELVGVPFEERWKRLDDAIPALRTLMGPSGQPHDGPFYRTEGALSPLGGRPDGPPIWVGSWGSAAGLRRVARADGWLASAYNTTPRQFGEGKAKLAAFLQASGRDPAAFPNGLSTTFMYLADSDTEAERVLRDVVIPVMNRPYEELSERLLVCTPADAIERIQRYEEAGLQRMFLWPLLDDEAQLKRFTDEVMAAL